MTSTRRKFLVNGALAGLAGIGMGGMKPFAANQKDPVGAKAAAGSGAGAGNKQKTDRPNLLLLFPDQMRADAMGCNGNPVIKTPHMDRLAAGGVLFPTAYAQNPVCVPSRCSLSTSQYPHANGCKDNGMNWPTDIPNMAPILASEGYRTISVGKMHFWPNLWLPFGFEKRVLAEDKAIGWNDEYREYLEAKGLYHLSSAMHRKKAGNLGTTNPIPEEHYIDSFVARRAIEEIKHSDERPWFMWLGFPSPHFPIDPPAPWSTMYSPDDITLPPFDPKEYKTKPKLQQDQENIRSFYTRGHDPHLLRNLVAHYYGLVSLVDKWIGKIIDVLEQSGQLHNTLIVLAADHGEYAGDHGAIEKDYSCYEGLIRVPFIVHWPAGFEGGWSSPALVENVDVLPTFLEAAGIEIPWGVQGRSLLPVLRKQTRTVREYAFSEYLFQKMIRRDRWKLIYYAGHELGELYDLDEDPYEARNLYLAPRHRALRNELTHLLLTQLVSTESPGQPGNEKWGAKQHHLKEPHRGSI